MLFGTHLSTFFELLQGTTNMTRSRSIIPLVAMAFVLKASTAFGGVVTDSGAFTFPLSPGNAVVTLALFDPILGSLDSVTIEISGTVEANITAENDSAIAGNMSVNLTGLLGVTAPGVAANANILQSAGPVAVASTDGNAGSGPDFNDFGLVGAAGVDSANAAFLAPYVGPGTFNATVTGNGGFSISGVTDSTLQISNFAGSGTVTVTYNYTAIPEPSSIAFCAVAVVGLTGFRKRRRIVA